MDPLATKRVHVLVRVAFIWAALILARLIQLQVFQHPKFAEMAREQQQKVEEIKAPRGAILDRYGQRLAMSLPAESVVVDPLRVPDLSVAADVLSKVLSLDARDLLAKLKTAVDDSRGFLWVKRKITPQEAKRLRDLDLEWIEFRTESERFYPNRSLAAHVIGSVDFQEDGNGGVEQSLNDRLAGHTGEMLVTKDVQRHGFASELESAAEPGQDVRLTIDSRIQFVAEQELAKMVALHHAKSGSLVAMDPRSGDILAMANVPTFDPNLPPNPSDLAARENRSGARSMASLYPATVLVIPGVGHIPFEEMPDVCNRAMRDWLSSPLPAGLASADARENPVAFNWTGNCVTGDRGVAEDSAHDGADRRVQGQRSTRR